MLLGCAYQPCVTEAGIIHKPNINCSLATQGRHSQSWKEHAYTRNTGHGWSLVCATAIQITLTLRGLSLVGSSEVKSLLKNLLSNDNSSQ